MTEPQPHVLLDLDHREGLLYLVLANVGAGPAYDVQVEFSRQLGSVEGAPEVSALALFRNLPLLRPGKAIEVLWDSAATALGRDRPSEFEARVQYRDRHGQQHKERFRHDAAIYRDWVEVRRPGRGH